MWVPFLAYCEQCHWERERVASRHVITEARMHAMVSRGHIVRVIKRKPDGTVMNIIERVQWQLRQPAQFGLVDIMRER